MNCLTQNKPTGIAIIGRMLEINLSIKPRLTMIINLGIVTAIGTNIIAKVLISNNNVLPLNFFLDKTYPALTASKTLTITVNMVTKIELNKYLAAGTLLVANKANKSWKFFQVGLTTKMDGGNLNNSS